MATDMAFKRTFDLDQDDSNSGSEKKKKRRSRWGDTESEKNILTGLPVVIPQGLTKEQEEQYLLQLQIEETTRRLRTGELGIPSNPGDRSPSPEPIYSQEGKRLNTREYRTRKKLEEERHHLILKVQQLNPDYKPPADYRPPLIRVSDRVSIPQEEHPEINFVGLLIGPRGNTLRNIEKETGTTIIIRGKGSVKEGKVGYKDGRPLPAQDEPLHAYITSSNAENVKKAVDKIKTIIIEGITIPDAENDLRRQQLRELALLNGTLRENDALTKLKQFQEAQTIITNTILCIICGGAGHIAADCKQRRPGETLKAAVANATANAPVLDKSKMDNEYMSLMAELGQGPPPSPQHSSSSSSSFTPALPMLGVSRPPLALPAPVPSGPQGGASGQGSLVQPDNQMPSFVVNSSRPPLNLPPPKCTIPSLFDLPVALPAGFNSKSGNGGNFMSGPGSQPMSMGIRPLMQGVPPPSSTSLSLSGNSTMPPWQQQNSNKNTSAAPTMLPPPPPPPFCSLPVPPPGVPGPLPWQQHQQSLTALRPVPPPAPVNNTVSGAGLPPTPWCQPQFAAAVLTGVPPPPPSFAPWNIPLSSSSSSVSAASSSASSATSLGAAGTAGQPLHGNTNFTLPPGMNLAPPPPPPPN
jgi:splicing factor 1